MQEINMRFIVTERTDETLSSRETMRSKHWKTSKVLLFIVLFLVITIGCGGKVVEVAKERPETHSQTPKDAGSVTNDEACMNIGESRRLEIEVGGSATTQSGLTVRFKGTSHDDFEDGRFDVNLIIEIIDTTAGGEPFPWMPSAIAKPAYKPFGAYCLRLVNSSDQRITVDIAPVAANEPDPLPHCAISCCPDNLQVPAPDGTIECCFCEEIDLHH